MHAHPASISRFPRFLAAGLGLALLVAAAGCGGGNDGGTAANNGGGGNAAAEYVINMGAFNDGAMAFVPDRDTVQVGQVVRIRNGDSLAHRIESQTAGGPSWGTISAGAFADQTAGTAGTFTFVCTIQGHTMSGILVVLP